MALDEAGEQKIKKRKRIEIKLKKKGGLVKQLRDRKRWKEEREKKAKI